MSGLRGSGRIDIRVGVMGPRVKPEDDDREGDDGVSLLLTPTPSLPSRGRGREGAANAMF